MSLVLDGSATLAFVYSGETTEPIRHVFDAVANEGAIVPALRRLDTPTDRAPHVRCHIRSTLSPNGGGRSGMVC
jgi:hypothetical protein